MGSLDGYLAELLEEGHRAFSDKDFVEARRRYDEVLQHDPQNFQALANRAATYVGEQKFDKAIEGLNVALEQKPTDSSTLRVRGAVYLIEMEDVAKALDDFDRALEHDPGNSWIHFLRAEAMRQSDEPAKSIADLTIAIHRPNSKLVAAVAHDLRGNAWRELNQDAAAAADFAMAGRLRPDYGLYWIKAARVLATSADPEVRDGQQAVNYALPVCEAIEDPPPEWIAVLAASYAELGDLEFAVHAQEKAVEAADHQLEGLGVLLKVHLATLRLFINGVVEGSPADRAGLQPGDRIFKIDNFSVNGVPYSEVSRRLAGDLGTSVKLTVRRDGEPEPLVIEVVRGRYRDETFINELKRCLELYKAGKSFEPAPLKE